MSLYALGFTGASSNFVSFEVISAASVGFRVLEVASTCTSSTTAITLSRPTVGGTATSPKSLVSEDPNNTTAAVTTIATSWSAAPTFGSSIGIRKYNNSGTGGGVIWYFPRGITCTGGGSGANSSLAMQNGTNVISYCWVVVEE